MRPLSTAKGSEMVKMFKRGNKLYLEYEANGRVVQKSTRLDDTPQNRALIKKEVMPALQRKIITGELSGNKPKDFKYYSEILLRDKTHLKSFTQITKQMEVINQAFGSLRIDVINRGMIKDWVSERLKINSPKTVKDYLTHVRGVFIVALDKEVIIKNPCDNISFPEQATEDIEPFSGDEVRKILSSCNEWWRLFLGISFFTGMRTGEVLALQRGDIDISNRVIHIKRSISKGRITTPKTKKSIRDVPILDDLLPFLKLPKTLSWIFPKQDGDNYFAVSGQKKEEWAKLLKDCDIEYRKLYVTRHTFIVSMLKNSDLSILEIAQMAGHSSTQMIIHNYGKFIKGEHLKIDRGIKLFTDKTADSIA